ncbi:hypothetical protein KKC91_01390 [bacterium]|nr:hypothetical protein [bacterium]
MSKINSNTRFPNFGKRDLGRRRAYEIFIDIGSYRTTVLCLPHGDRNDERDRLGNIESYLIPFRGKYREFPSSYLKTAGGVKLLSDEVVDDVKSGNITYYDEKKIVTSAKRDFIHDFLDYPEGLDSDGKPTNFVLYIKTLLEHTFRVITCDDEKVIINGNEVEVDEHWRSSDVPSIEGIQVTVPDLYIENLRQGYCTYILKACESLCNKSSTDLWKVLLEGYNKYSKGLLEINKNKSKQKVDGFVSISADESGAGELYFMESMKVLSSIRFYKADLDKYNILHIKHLFSQRPEISNAGQNEITQKIICCRIDMGGITTDAGVSLVEFFDKKLSNKSDNKELRYKLLKKESFSQRIAGEKFKEEFGEYGYSKENWWENIDFIRDEKNCSFVKIIKRIINSQYKAVKQLFLSEDKIDGVYFVISGRPTMSDPVKEALLQIILDYFNNERLLLLKESCIFVSDLPLIYYDWQGGNWHVSYRPELAKWVTAAVGEKMLSNSSKYEIGTQGFDYYVKVDHFPPVDGGDLQTINGSIDKAISLENFDEFKSQMEDGAVRVGLSFSPKKDGEFISFLDVLNRSCKNEYPTEQGKCYPKLKVGSAQTPLSNKAWIIPSIYIEDIDRKIHEFVWKG